MHTEYYTRLGLRPSATPSEIKKAYRKKAIQLHPDKLTGNKDAFQKLSAAYEVLSDPEKRRAYDQFGVAGVEGGARRNPFDLFSTMFGPGRAPHMPRKCRPQCFDLKVTLEDLYTGVTKKLRVTRNERCAACADDGGWTCKSCQGNGVQVRVRQLAPGMLQQQRTMCSDCQGSGMVRTQRCESCDDKRTKKTEEILEVPIAPGMRWGHQHVFKEKGDQAPREHILPGDIIVTLAEKKHAYFQRRGDDLVLHKTISLAESLLGFSFSLTLLNGTTVVIQTAAGKITPSNTTWKVPGLGMRRENDLLVLVAVRFPDQLSPTQLATLQNDIFPSHKPPQSGQKASTLVLEQAAKNLGQEKEKAADFQPHRPGGPDGAECRTQ